jgi:hypothetical protein
MDRDLKHFTRPYRIGNIIILVLVGIVFVPLFLGLTRRQFLFRTTARSGPLFPRDNRRNSEGDTARWN